MVCCDDNQWYVVMITNGMLWLANFVVIRCFLIEYLRLSSHSDWTNRDHYTSIKHAILYVQICFDGQIYKGNRQDVFQSSPTASQFAGLILNDLDVSFLVGNTLRSFAAFGRWDSSAFLKYSRTMVLVNSLF